MKDQKNVSPENPQNAEYEAPQVEHVMDAEELAREVHYAGEVPTVPISA